MLRAWLEWPGDEPGESEQDAALHELGETLRVHGFVTGLIDGDDPTAEGRRVLAELEAHEGGAVAPATVSGSWGWGTSPNQIDGREDDREAAIAAAREAEDGATVYVWPRVRDIDPAVYLPNAEDLIESMGVRAYHDRPVYIQDDPWPDVDADAKADLAKLLGAWASKHCKTWWVADGEPEAVPPEAT